MEESMSKNFRNCVLAQLAVLAFVGCSMTLHASSLDCTNTIVVPGGSGVVLNSQVTSGTCIQTSDKLFGDFNVGNLPTGGFMLFVSNTALNRVSLTFSGSFLADHTYNFGYQVAVINSTNFISRLSVDLVQTTGTSTLMTTLTPPGTGMINFTKTDNVPSGTSLVTFTEGQTGGMTLAVNETFHKGADSDASAVLNSIGQSPSVIPEPSSLLLFGSGLLGLATYGRRRFLKR
jgi:hypothetical protein